MKNLKLFKSLLVLIGVLIANVNMQGQMYTSRSLNSSALQPTVKMHSVRSTTIGAYSGASKHQIVTMHSMRGMSVATYNGTIYEPFEDSAPSEQNNAPARIPGRPHKEQAADRTPGEVDPEAASNQSPVGEPWVMMLFALAFAGVTALRIRRKKMIEQTETQNNETMIKYGKYIAMLALLLTLGIGQMWAWNVTENSVYYFKPSGAWKGDNARFAVAFGNSETTYDWYSCIAVPGETDLYYVVSPGNYDWMIFCRMKPDQSANNWDNRWNECGKLSPNNNYNRFEMKSDWSSDFNWYKYAPPMESASLTNNSTTYGGDGSSEDPYQIATGSTLSVTASANSYVANGYTKYYQFYKKVDSGSRSTWDSESNSTTTKTLTANAAAGHTYEIDVVARNEYYSSYGTTATSDVMYFVTVSPFSAILGSFNSWNHSAATWDLADQGSNNWDATFHLDAGNYTFKVVYDLTHYGKNSTTITRASNSATGLSTSGANINLTADYSGDYTFRFNSSSKNLTVTFPTIRQVNYSIVTSGSGTGTAGSLSAEDDDDGDRAVSSGGYVVNGHSVTFKAPSAKTGYEFKGWYSTSTPNPANWSTNRLTTSANYTVTVSGGNKTVYAVYYEPTHSVTVAAQDNHGTADVGGSTNVTSVSGVGVSTASSTITATPTNAAWRFKQWNIPSGVTLASGSTTSTSITIKATADSKTITAVFEPRYGLVGSRKADGDPTEGMPGWGNGSAADFVVTSFTSTSNMSLTCARTLLPNRRYKFQVYDRSASSRDGCTTDGGALMSEGQKWKLDGTNDVWIDTKGYGTYTFEITAMDGSNKPSVQVRRVTSYQLANMAWADVNVNGTINKTSRATGGSVTAQTTESGNHYSIAQGQYVASGGSITFTATPASGYTLEGWYTNNDYAVGHKISSGGNYSIDGNTLTVSSISANVNVYAKFVETATEVYLTTYSSTGKIQVETATGVWTDAANLPTRNTINVGVTTNYNIRAVANTGYYFDNWEVVAVTQDFQLDDDAVADYGEDNAEATLKGQGKGTSTQMLRANFSELDKIYFRNDNGSGTKLWTNVYAYFDITIVDNCAKSKATTDASYIAAMTEIDDSKVYWAYVPRAFTRKVGDNHNGQVAFSNYNFGNDNGAGYKFYKQEGIKWTSYTKSLNMCVPNHAIKETYNETKYHDCYWKKYSSYVGFLGGYYLMTYDGSSYGHALPDYYFTILDGNTIQTTYTIKDASVDYKFMIKSFGEIKYITQDSPIDADGEDVYANACTDVTMTQYDGGSPYFVVHPNMEGVYTFTIDQSGEKMKLTVHYPVEVGDYRLKHTYTAGSSKTTYSNVVKAATVAVTDTVSLFLFKSAGSPSTTLQKCTSIDGSTKMPVFTDCTSGTTNLGGCNSLENSGVYKIGITVANDAVSNTPVVEAYTGNYYIRVKGANTRNYLTNGETKYGSSIGTKFTKFIKNSAFGDTYDYYWVDWFLAGSAQSITATIQNDYNPDLAGKIADGISTLTTGANVRYGYDSESNEFTYAMISGGGEDIKISSSKTGNVTVKNASSGVYEDAYPTPRSAKDQDNWMYAFTSKVKEGSTASIKSTYNAVTTTLAENKKLIGGTGSSIYDIEVMYDFKTNRIMASWAPDPEEELNTTFSLESNLILVRQEDGKPTLLNLVKGEGEEEGALSDITQIFTVLEVTKANWNKASWTITSGGYTDAYFWISLPYDCYVSDIFGLDKYGDQWVIQTYHGDYRAEKGWWAETENWWYNLDRSDKMNANQGYVVRLTNLESSSNIFTLDGVTTARLYFPSSNAGALSIGLLGESTTTIVPEHKCEIWRGKESNTNEGNPNYDRRAIDSNWNIIGSPCFNSAKISTTGWGETYPSSPSVTGTLQFFYTWSVSTNTPTYTVQNASAVAGFEFPATHAYFVQYAGELTWIPYSTTPFVGLKAPARNKETSTDQTLHLVLSQGDIQADATYICRMEEGATEDYDLNMDLSKVMNSRQANVYTLAGYYKMAGNCLPDTVSVVPVGVRTAAAGSYTFSLPEGTNGTGVVLVDNATGARTNLALTDYTVTLAKGTFDNRFSLELSPIANIPTGIGNNLGNSDNAQKKIIDGVLYLVRDGQVFDARGARVE